MQQLLKHGGHCKYSIVVIVVKATKDIFASIGEQASSQQSACIHLEGVSLSLNGFVQKHHSIFTWRLHPEDKLRSSLCETTTLAQFFSVSLIFPCHILS